jgi:hypothetical protein
MASSRNRFNAQTGPGVAITRGGSAIVSGSPEALPFGGVDNGDGTCSLMVSGGGGGGGGGGSSVASNIYTNQFAVGSMPVSISNPSPVSTQFQIIVNNAGTQPMWVGGSGVTQTTGYPIYSGGSASFPIGNGAVLYAVSPNGTTAAVMALG